jgi:hypothetical protein
VASFRAQSNVVGTASTDPAPGEPTGTAPGDLLVAWAVIASTGSLSLPTGWTLLSSGTQGAFKWLHGYIPRGASAVSTTFAQTGGSLYREVHIGCWKSDSGQSLELNAQSAAGASGNAATHNPNPPSVTPTKIGVAVCGGVWWAGSGTAWAGSAGYTVRARNTAGDDVVFADKPLSAVAAEDPAAFSGAGSATNDYWDGMTLVISEPVGAVVSLLGSLFNTTGGTSITTGTLTPVGTVLPVAVAAVTGSVATDWAVTDSLGGTWTKIGASRAQKGTNADLMEVWVRNATTSSAFTATYSHATGAATGGGLVVLAAAGMSRTGASAVRGAGVQSNQASGTAPAPVLGQTTLLTNPTVTAVFDASTAGLTVPAGWAASDFNAGFTVPTAWLQVTHRNSGFAGTTITWGSNAGSAYCSLGIELDASAPAAAAQVPGPPFPGLPAPVLAT